MKHHTKRKGDLAVAKVITDLNEKGYEIFIPLSEHTRADLIAVKDDIHKIQVKYCKDGFLRSKTSWADKNGSHVKYYEDNDFDFYALYNPDFDIVIYAHISYKGKTIRFTKPKSSGEYLWYEDFTELNNIVDKRTFSIDDIKKRDYVKKQDHIKWPSKEELEKMVWEKPTSQIAEELGVSDVAIGKKCKVLGIEKPPRGYWTKEKSRY